MENFSEIFILYPEGDFEIPLRGINYFILLRQKNWVKSQSS